MMDATLRARCPSCRAINWSRDGFTMAVDVNGELHRVRAVPAGSTVDADTEWTCGRCGYRPAEDSDLVQNLYVLLQSESRGDPRP
jgi:hypothetical protein